MYSCTKCQILTSAKIDQFKSIKSLIKTVYKLSSVAQVGGGPSACVTQQGGDVRHDGGNAPPQWTGVQPSRGV